MTVLICPNTGGGTAPTNALIKTNNLSDVTDVAASRTNLGLGTAATEDVGTSANNVVQLDGSARLPAVDGSQLTGITATGSLLVANNLSDLNNVTTARTNLGLGTAATQDVGTTANDVVQLNSSAQLPAVDGSLLTGITATDSTKLAIANNLSDLNNVATARTNLGLGTAATQDVGTTANNVVQLDGSARLPAVDGSQLTGITATDSTKLAIANNLSDLNNVATARTNLGLGTAATQDVGTANGNVVQLDATGLPAVDGSQLLNVSATDSTKLAIANNLSDLNNVVTARTNLGLGTAATQDVGTAANNVVQLDGSARLPAVDGSQLTGIAGSQSLDDVVQVGSTTATAIQTGGLTVTGDIDPNANATYYLGDENTRFISYYGDMNGAIRFKAKVDQTGGLSKGEVVYIKGVSGSVPTVGKAQANSASTMPAFGLVYANANDTADVEIITFGNLENMATNTFGAGNTLYVSSTTAGGLVNSAPTGEANLIQNIGFVVRSDASAGIVKVGGAGRTNATPNLDQDKIFLGNGSNQAVSTAISSIALSGFNNDLTLDNVVANGDSTTSPITVGDLKINSNAAGTSTSGSIATTASNYNIILDPHGSGVVELEGNTTRGSGQIQFNCELNSHGVKLEGPPHSAAATYTMILPDSLGTTGQYLRLQDQSTGELYFSDATSTDTLDDVTTNGATTSNALTTGNLLPNTAGVNTLGSNTKEWGNVYLADNTNMYFGADQDVILKHDADSGLTVKMSATAQNNNTPRFVLQNEGTTSGSKFVQVFNETSPSPNDVIGYLIGNARNSNNALLDFTQIESLMIDNTQGQLQSGLVFKVRNGGTGTLLEGLKVFSDNSADIAPKVRISNAFNMPSADGSANQVLQTDGAGEVTWQTLSASPLAYDGTQGTANFSTVEGTHYSVDTSGASADITATLPAASVSNAGKEVRFKLMDATHGLVIAVQTNQILEGTTNGTYTLDVALQSITCVSNGNNGWEII